MNAVAHAVEALYAENGNPIVSLMAEEGIAALGRSLPVVVKQPADMEARSDALYGAWLCGISLGAVGMALHHKLCHVLGGSFDLPHAETHTIVIAHAAAYNRDAAPEAMARIAKALGVKDAPAGLYDLAAKIGAPMRLKDIGLQGIGPRPRGRYRGQEPLLQPASGHARRHPRSARRCLQRETAGAGKGVRGSGITTKTRNEEETMTKYRFVSETKNGVTRRRFVQATGAAAGVAAASSLLPMPAIAAERPIKLGYVSPQTGPLAAFGEADKFIGRQRPCRAQRRHQGRQARHYPVEIIVKDSQSNPNRAAEVATSLIQSDKIDLMLVASTPETTNPVSDQCEINEMPCVSTMAPWQPWFFARGGKPDTASSTLIIIFWGLEDVIAVFTNMWGKLATDKVVGGLFPNDGDGNAWGDQKLGFPPVLDKLGYKLIDPGRYQNLTDDFSAQISAFKKAKASRSSPAWSFRPISPRSGPRRASRASAPRPRRSARRCCSRSPSRRWATPATTCPPRSGGARPIRSNRR